MLYFSSNRDGPHNLFVSLRDIDGVWGTPSPVTELNSPGFNTLRPTASHDGREIVFDSDRPGGLGSFDVWTAVRPTAHSLWSMPVNLGEDINSASAETRASLSRDGRRLYFGSPRPGGQGNSDIYVATAIAQLGERLLCKRPWSVGERQRTPECS